MLCFLCSAKELEVEHHLHFYKCLGITTVLLVSFMNAIIIIIIIVIMMIIIIIMYKALR